jgi:hypothetical protein
VRSRAATSAPRAFCALIAVKSTHGIGTTLSSKTSDVSCGFGNATALLGTNKADRKDGRRPVGRLPSSRLPCSLRFRRLALDRGLAVADRGLAVADLDPVWHLDLRLLDVDFEFAVVVAS